MSKFSVFEGSIKKIMLAHGRKPLSDEMMEDMWEQCQYIDSDAWPFIVGQFRDMDTPPKNMAKAAKAFHFSWLETQSTGKTNAEIASQYHEGVIGPRIMELRRAGIGSLEALAEACGEYRRGELDGAHVGRGPRFNVDDSNRTHEYHGPMKAGW